MSTPLVDPAASTGQIATQVNSVIKDVQSMQTVQVFKDDTGVRRVILDKDGLRTSEEGVDVYDATDDQLTFDSRRNTLKVAMTGTTTVTASAGSGVADTVSHNLGFVPVVIATAHSPNFPSADHYAQLTYVESPYSATDYVVANVLYQDENDVVFNVDLGAGAGGHAGDWEIKYYLLLETAN